MISGSALETTVDDRIATNMPSSSPVSASMICRCVIGVPSEAPGPVWPACPPCLAWPPRTPVGVVVAIEFLSVRICFCYTGVRV